jgi:dUTP pyrophosphatase
MASQIQILKFVKISKNATTPTKGSPFSAGYDLYAAKDLVILFQNVGMIPTDLKISVPSGTYGRIASRSSLSVKNIHVTAGVIDEDYPSPVNIVLHNGGFTTFTVKKGDKIAQLICKKILYPALLEVAVLDTTQRGEKGFGSTGMRKNITSKSPKKVKRTKIIVQVKVKVIKK